MQAAPARTSRLAPFIHALPTQGAFDWDPEVLQLLRAPFGLRVFRPIQREVINATLQGRDVLCLMPSGGGKVRGCLGGYTGHSCRELSVSWCAAWDLSNGVEPASQRPLEAL